MVAMGSVGHDAAPVVYYQQRPHCQAVPELVPCGGGSSQASRVMQKVERWVFLYNLTTGLYMLDWWERCVFNVVFLVFFLVACYNSGHYVCRLGARLVAWCGDDAAASFAFGRRIREGFLGGGGVHAAGG